MDGERLWRNDRRYVRGRRPSKLAEGIAKDLAVAVAADYERIAQKIDDMIAAEMGKLVTKLVVVDGQEIEVLIKPMYRPKE